MFLLKQTKCDNTVAKERTGEEFLMQTDKPAKEHEKWGHCYVASLICSSSAQAP